MPKRRTPKVGITPEQIEFLVRGYAYFDSEPFKDEDDARAMWSEYGDEVLSLRDAGRDDRPSPGAHFASGTRPWGWWKFEQGEDPPLAQGGLLEEMGELLPGEREKALELAKEQWLGSPPGSTRRDPVGDEALLAAWPRFPEEDE